jgi:uncharacterized membrane protein YeiB
LSQGAALGHTQRIRIIDIIRGVAVLGIFTMNAADMAYPEHFVLDFHAADPGGGWNYQVAFISELLFSGKMRGLFTLLFGLAQFNSLSRLELAAFVFLVCIFQLIFSVIWMKRFHYGPAEWLWRSLTYWKLQPLRRTVT